MDIIEVDNLQHGSQPLTNITTMAHPSDNMVNGSKMVPQNFGALFNRSRLSLGISTLHSASI